MLKNFSKCEPPHHEKVFVFGLLGITTNGKFTWSGEMVPTLMVSPDEDMADGRLDAAEAAKRFCRMASSCKPQQDQS